MKITPPGTAELDRKHVSMNDQLRQYLSLSLSLILTVWGVRVCVSACLSLSHTHTRQPIHPPYDDALGAADGSESEHLNCVPHTLP